MAGSTNCRADVTPEIMELRTTVNIDPPQYRITYNDPVMFIGSCFATSIGKKLETGRFPVMINPSGTVYNPVSVSNTLESTTSGKKYGQADIHIFGGRWLSFNHYTDFSSDTPESLLHKMNKTAEEAAMFLARAKYLFITFGTARIYKLNLNGKIVSNCHKLPSGEFSRELLSVGSIVKIWNTHLDDLQSRFPDLKVIFTISPVRHWKDGPHGNQISKSVLFLAVEELLNHPSSPGYFPAYEIMMDDLRDYRFYSDDMLHPSTLAVDYIWESFMKCYFDSATSQLWQEVSKIARAMEHRMVTESIAEKRKFAGRMLEKIDSLSVKAPFINLKSERDYFQSLLSD